MENKTPKMERPQVAEFVTRDLEICVSFINLVRNNPEILNALIDVIHVRVQADQESKEVQPELEFDGRE